jgi:putative component of toxin-antitoxin plasmid stabilization module
MPVVSNASPLAVRPSPLAFVKRRRQLLWLSWVWHDAHKDKRAVAIIRVRLNRIRLSNFGDSHPPGGGVED